MHTSIVRAAVLISLVLTSTKDILREMAAKDKWLIQGVADVASGRVPVRYEKMVFKPRFLPVPKPQSHQ